MDLLQFKVQLSQTINKLKLIREKTYHISDVIIYPFNTKNFDISKLANNLNKPHFIIKYLYFVYNVVNDNDLQTLLSSNKLEIESLIVNLWLNFVSVWCLYVVQQQ